MSRFNNLYASGLVNKDTEDLGAIAMGRRLTPVPFCSSPLCTSGSGREKVRISGKVPGNDCPNCGYAIVWKRMYVKHDTSKYVMEE